MIYLATPYSHPDPSIQELRYEKACELTSILVQNSVPCYSPIAFWHPISRRFGLPGDYEFWKDQDSAAMRGCAELWVIQLEGWSCSRGVAHEMDQWHDARTLYVFAESELTEMCQMYHERRNASVIAAMKTVNVEAGTSSRTAGVVERLETTTEPLAAQAVLFPPL